MWGHWKQNQWNMQIKPDLFYSKANTDIKQIKSQLGIWPPCHRAGRLFEYGFAWIISAHRSWGTKTCLQSLTHCVARCHCSARYISLTLVCSCLVGNKKLILAACVWPLAPETRLRQIWTKMSLLQVFHGKNIEVLLAKVCFTKRKNQQKATRLFN